VGSRLQEASQVGGRVVGSEGVGDEDLKMVWRACKGGERVGKGPASEKFPEKGDGESGVACMGA
jgi:hypothetical protein